uniref:Putative secreted protein n=1 Tax=Anopheles darlingi TaxID=43151 RepID=A0A2M4DE76_ANODA
MPCTPVISLSSLIDVVIALLCNIRNNNHVVRGGDVMIFCFKANPVNLYNLKQRFASHFLQVFQVGAFMTLSEIDK